MEKVTTHVGLDVHAERIVLASLTGQAKEPTVWDIPNDERAIRRTFHRLARQAYELRCCYEAGPCGFELHRQLTAMSIECDVVAPSLIPVRTGDRVKTDKRDAVKLARLFRAGELTTITVPSVQQEALRDLLRARDDVRKDLVAARNRLAKFLIRHGHFFRGGRKKWTKRFWIWLRTLEFERETERLTFEHYVHQVEHQLERRAELDRHINRIAQTDAYAEPVARLACLRGISTLAAMVLLAEIGDFRRFGSPRQLMSFLGLVPREYSSGGKEKRGGLTKTGNTHVRRLLVEASWAYRHRPALGPRTKKALEGQPPAVTAYAKKAQVRLHRRFTRLLSRGKNGPLAAAAVARELSGFAWGIMTM